jgi:UDP-N-acetylmuramate: L-alanyl-gamma-D-glutamyl-meso-diaminopimelate ligase
VHYRPRTAILNNLEFDHADIFPDVAAIQRQFHHLVRTIPSGGLIVSKADDDNLNETLKMGCWTPVERVATGTQDAEWQAHKLDADGSRFEVLHVGVPQGVVAWSQLGDHNLHNALAAIAAARHVGVPVAQAIAALADFQGVKRRMELRGIVRGATVYDDFAHHPTAIETTLAGLRRKVGEARILAVLEPRSNTMRLGVHRAAIAPALAQADRVWLYEPPDLGWELADVAHAARPPTEVIASIDALVAALAAEARSGDHILIMSNGGFGGIHAKLLAALGE